jgi:hypothetical protein
VVEDPQIWPISYRSTVTEFVEDFLAPIFKAVKEELDFSEYRGRKLFRNGGKFT